MVAARSWRTEAGLYSRFTEGLQSLDLKEITALLDEFEPIGRSPETSLQGRAPRVSFQEVVPSPISGGWVVAGRSWRTGTKLVVVFGYLDFTRDIESGVTRPGQSH